MPVAAKFSEGFYERFGHDATDELVEYLNAVDRTYRSDLERLNDANWSRFEDRLEQRFAASDLKLEQRFAAFEIKFTALEGRFAALEGRVDRLEAKMEQRFAEMKADMLKWMFLFWLGTIGIVLALQKL